MWEWLVWRYGDDGTLWIGFDTLSGPGPAVFIVNAPSRFHSLALATTLLPEWVIVIEVTTPTLIVRGRYDHRISHG
jgi:hypothetical protein